MIGIRIKPNQEISEFDPDTDREYINMDKDGYSLIVPERWEHKTFKLSFMVENYASDFNMLATEWFNALYTPMYSSTTNQAIYGNVYILNEDDNGPLDFTFEDFNYINYITHRIIK
jgi:hypothetical protein